MATVTYHIVPHDGGWTHDLARKAAERAAAEQIVPGDTTEILYEDKQGHWHGEVARGDDRPATEVEG